MNSSRLSWRAGVVQRLRRQGRVAVDEGQRGGADEHRLERVQPRLVRGALRERVLDHPEPGVGVAELDPQVGDLRDRDPAVVDREDRVRLLKLAGDLVDDRCFLVSVHSSLSLKRNARWSAGVFGRHKRGAPAG